MNDEELVRCRPCGYVMKSNELGDVCPACGLPRNVFEPYREKVSPNRLFVLGLDIHPISIHLSQTFVVLAPLLMTFHLVFQGFKEELIHPVIAFSVYILPFALILAFVSGLLDGVTRFKTLRTPLLRQKIIYGCAIFAISLLEVAIFRVKEYGIVFILVSLAATACAIKLGLIGKHLIDVILPGSLVIRKAVPQKYAPKGAAEKTTVQGSPAKEPEEFVHEE